MISIRYIVGSFLIFVGAFWGCTPPEHGAEFYIHNSTDQKLRVVYKHFQSHPIVDTTYINPHEEKFLGKTWDYANNIDEYMFDLSSTKFDTLHISLANNGSSYKKDALDIQNWLKIIPENGRSIGTVRLTVKAGDF